VRLQPEPPPRQAEAAKRNGNGDHGKPKTRESLNSAAKNAVPTTAAS